MKSQSATEYIILLAAVIVIAIVVVGILGGIPGIGSKDNERTTTATRAGNKVTIVNYALFESGMKLTLRNNNAEIITVSSVYVNETPCITDDLPTKFSVGQTKTISCSNIRVIEGASFRLPTNVTWIDSQNARYILVDELVGTGSVGNITISETPSAEETEGICGTANGENLSEAPTTNLCTNGTATAVVGTGPWEWNCTGTESNASCSANLLEECSNNPNFNGGCGTAETPYLIASCTQLQNMSENLSAYFMLSQNIDCSETTTWNWDGTRYRGFDPVGTFTGNFDGAGFTISNLYINYSSSHYTEPDGQYYGLFSILEGDASNVIITDFNIKGDHYLGGLAGKLYGGTIDNSYASGNIFGRLYIGSLVGENENGQITNCGANANIDVTNDKAGGLVGRLVYGEISNSYSEGQVFGYGAEIGGLVGYNDHGTISNSYSKADVAGDIGEIGGLVGGSYEGDVLNSYSIGAVSGNFDPEYGSGGSVGGISGTFVRGTLSNSFSTSAVSEGNELGGLIGAFYPGTISNSYWDISLTGQANCYHEGSTDCTSTNQESLYFGASGIPFANLSWDTDIWTAVEGDYPILSWQ